MQTARIACAGAWALACAFYVGGAWGQAYPTRAIRFVVPTAPGGGPDVIARFLTPKLTEILGQQVVVDNRAGANALIGADVVAKSPADGYTVLVHSAAHVSNPHLYSKISYDTLKDFIGISPLGRQVGMLVVHPSLPVNDRHCRLGNSACQLEAIASGGGDFRRPHPAVPANTCDCRNRKRL